MPPKYMTVSSVFFINIVRAFPFSYAVIGALSLGFIVLGVALSSVMIAFSGFGLLATIGSAILEIKTKRK